MRKKGTRNTQNLAAEAAFAENVRAIAPSARPGLLAWLRQAYTRPSVIARLRHRRRTFYELDPKTGRWRRLR